MVMFAACWSVNTAACGCEGCNYSEEMACSRCCTAFLKRDTARLLEELQPIDDEEAVNGWNSRNALRIVRPFARPFRFPILLNRPEMNDEIELNRPFIDNQMRLTKLLKQLNIQQR